MFNESNPGRADEPATPFRSGLTAWRRWKPSDCRTAGLLTLLIMLQLAGAVLIPLEPLKDGLWRYLSLGAMGAIVAPITLLALWAVFGPQRAAVRLPLTLWLVGASGLAVAAGGTLANGEADERGLFIATGWPLAFGIVQLPLWLLRAARRWRLDAPADPTDQLSAESSRQFTLRGLLGWTLAMASLLGAWRWVLSDHMLDPEEMLGVWMEIGLVSCLVALAGLPIVASAWILLAGGRRPVLRIVLFTLTVSGVVAAFGIMWHLDYFPEEIVYVEAGAIVAGVINLWVIWVCGYRLNRRKRSDVGFRSAKERSFAEPKPTFGDPPHAPIAARAPVGGWRFALALATLLLIAAGMAWSVPHRREMWRQAAVHVEWQRSNVNVSFDDSGKLTVLRYSHAAQVSDDTLQRIARLTDLESLDLSHSAIDNWQIALLAPLAGRLRELTLSGTNLSDAGLKELDRFRQLDFLNLTSTRVTDAGLAHLHSLAVLRTLHLALTDVTDCSFVTLAQLPNLQILDVKLTAVSESAAEKFEQDHPKIMVEFGASDGELLRSFSGTNYMVTFRTPIGRSIGFAREAPSARHLHAQGRLVTDTGMATISGITDIEELDLRDSAVTDAGLTTLTKLPNLRRLDLRGSAVTESGVARLATALPDCEIVR